MKGWVEGIIVRICNNCHIDCLVCLLSFFSALLLFLSLSLCLSLSTSYLFMLMPLPHHKHSNNTSYQAQRLTFSIFSLVGFMFVDLLYIAVIINYSCQCELLKAYIVNIKVKTRHKSYLLGDSVKVQCASKSIAPSTFCSLLCLLSMKHFYVCYVVHVCCNFT